MARLRLAGLALSLVALLTVGPGTALAAKGGQLGGVSAAPTTVALGTFTVADCTQVNDCMSSVYVTNNTRVTLTLAGIGVNGNGFIFLGIPWANPDQCTNLQQLAPGATCLAYVGFCTVVFCSSTDAMPLGRYTGTFSISWSDGARTYDASARLTARIVGG